MLVHQAVFIHLFIHHCLLESHKPFSKLYTVQNFHQAPVVLRFEVVHLTFGIL